MPRRTPPFIHAVRYLLTRQTLSVRQRTFDALLSTDTEAVLDGCHLTPSGGVHVPFGPASAELLDLFFARAEVPICEVGQRARWVDTSDIVALNLQDKTLVRRLRFLRHLPGLTTLDVRYLDLDQKSADDIVQHASGLKALESACSTIHCDPQLIATFPTPVSRTDPPAVRRPGYAVFLQAHDSVFQGNVRAFRILAYVRPLLDPVRGRVAEYGLFVSGYGGAGCQALNSIEVVLSEEHMEHFYDSVIPGEFSSYDYVYGGDDDCDEIPLTDLRHRGVFWRDDEQWQPWSVFTFDGPTVWPSALSMDVLAGEPETLEHLRLSGMQTATLQVEDDSIFFVSDSSVHPALFLRPTYCNTTWSLLRGAQRDGAVQALFPPATGPDAVRSARRTPESSPAGGEEVPSRLGDLVTLVPNPDEEEHINKLHALFDHIDEASRIQFLELLQALNRPAVTFRFVDVLRRSDASWERHRLGRLWPKDMSKQLEALGQAQGLPPAAPSATPFHAPWSPAWPGGERGINVDLSNEVNAVDLAQTVRDNPGMTSLDIRGTQVENDGALADCETLRTLLTDECTEWASGIEPTLYFMTCRQQVDAFLAALKAAQEG